MNTNYVVLFNDDGVSDISQQMSAHGDRLRQSLTERQITGLAYVEGALMFGTVEDAELDFGRLAAETQQTDHGQALARRIAQVRDDGGWWDRVRGAMRANLGGKTKMSRSGESIIFTEAQCGRHDLASWREFAQAQLTAAGIAVD